MFALVLSFAVLGGLVAARGGAASADTSGSHAPASALVDQSQIEVTPIGSPIWMPVDIHLFSAPIGTAPNYEEFMNTLLRILPPPNHIDHPDPDLGIGPGAPHPPPYDTEIREGVARAGFHERGPFTLPEFSPPNAVFLMWMVVPAPGTLGSSPDFASGPIIDDDLFPILVDYATYHEGELFSAPFIDAPIPSLSSIDVEPTYDVDGHSHFPDAYADNTSFALDPGADPTGDYTYTIEMQDQTGNGWRIDAHFTVVACTLSGSPGDNTLIGSSGSDVICGLGGNDTIFGRGGSDIVTTGAGNDRVFTGSGNDNVFTGDGDDRIFADAGNDIVTSGTGGDLTSGGDGNDTLYVRDEVDGNDTTLGGRGVDTCDADAGDRTIC